MNTIPDIKLLKSSWTKYDSVKIIQIVAKGELDACIKEIAIDEPVLRHFLGVEKLNDPLPYYWTEIYKYPEQVSLFALMAALFTHHENIERFAKQYSKGYMQGVFVVEEGKYFTNIRSALVESGAAEKIFRRKPEVPYDLSKLFEIGDVGILMKSLLKDRLSEIGYPNEDLTNNFYQICERYSFNDVFSLTSKQFTEWTSGKGVSDSLYELTRNGITYEKYGRIKALKVNQWLAEWNTIPRYGQKNRRLPNPHFYQFNIPALLLKRIYDVHSRRAFTERKDEQYSQRKVSEQRTLEIKEYVKGGYPWSTISREQRESETYKNLQMPGWLPTSIISNILSPNSERKQNKIENDSVIQIEDIGNGLVDIILPEKIWTDEWTPLVSPIEIIDGQHRIKSFDTVRELNGEYEFPIIAFYDLDFTWQAYLFYTINIKPKRINTSLAYDLMPLLRIQDWLEHDLDGPEIYKKVRAQELTELLWSCKISPWFNRINMLGETGENKGGPVSQNAFINSLTTSFVKRWDGRLGGLFGGEMNKDEEDIIQWDKETQAAYLILIWKAINYSIAKSKAEWVIDLKNRPFELSNIEVTQETQLPFIHPLSFFTTDQGIRPVLFIFNDMSFVANQVLGLNKFFADIDYELYSTNDTIELIIDKFKKDTIISGFISAIANDLINNFDWRTPSAFDSRDPDQDRKRQFQNQFRGSGGYRELRMQLIKILTSSKGEVKNPETNTIVKISDIALSVQSKYGF
ncbi:DGQHR domain-containing protein [Chitinophaga sp. RAB17]|uniref:DGQHR domain-containing protein n=1 Tax=Chitinophaga sp. RAB17 TaxID=3233049 RepID=UPI003F8EECE2